MTRINNSDGKINWTQRNNEYVWHYPKSGIAMVKSSTTCNVTSLCMQHSYNTGEDFPSGEFSQPEDNFAKFIMTTPEVTEFYRRYSPSMYNDFIEEKPTAYTPNEVHAVLEFAFNLWLGKEAIEFRTDFKIVDIIKELEEGRCVTSSGTFPYYSSISNRNTVLNHINVLVGYEKEKSKIKNIIIDDPYGNVHENFKVGITGNNVIISLKDFIKWYKPTNNIAEKFGYRTLI